MMTDNSTYTIRRATPADIASIRKMAEEAFRHTYHNILTPEQADYMMDWMYSEASLLSQLTTQRHTYCILSLPAEGDVGYVSFNCEPPDDKRDSLDGENTDRDSTAIVFHLQKLYLLPSAQGCGWGAVLFRHAERLMREAAGNASARFELNVNRNNHAVSFYEHMGMQKSREGDFDIGHGYYMNDYIMSKPL